MQLLFLLAGERQRELRDLAEARRLAAEAGQGSPRPARLRDLRGAVLSAARTGTRGRRHRRA